MAKPKTFWLVRGCEWTKDYCWLAETPVLVQDASCPRAWRPERQVTLLFYYGTVEVLGAGDLAPGECIKLSIQPAEGDA